MSPFFLLCCLLFFVWRRLGACLGVADESQRSQIQTSRAAKPKPTIMTSKRGSIAAKPARIIARCSFLVYLCFSCMRSAFDGRFARLRNAIRRYLGSSSPFIGAMTTPVSQSSLLRFFCLSSLSIVFRICSSCR